MDDRQFDDMARRIGERGLPLPRRGVLGLLGGGALSGALGLALAGPEDAGAKKNNKNKCKKEGKKCDKQQCKKKDKKCCCKDLKCKNDRCEGKGGNCPTNADFDDDWGEFGSGDGQFNSPNGITSDPDGNVYVTDSGNERVQAFNQNGVFQDEFGEDGEDEGEFKNPQGIVFYLNNNDDPRLYVSDPGQTTNSEKLRRFNGDIDSGNFGSELLKLGVSDLEDPRGLDTDNDNNLWVVNSVSPGEIFLFNDGGELLDSFEPGGSGQLNNPEGIAVFEDKDDNNTYIFVADTDNDRVVKFEYVGGDLQFVKQAGSAGSGSDRFNTPTGLAVDKCGNVWVADRFNDRIQLLDKNLNFEDNFTSGFNDPTDVAFGPDGDALYVVDADNERIVKFNLS